MVFRAELTDTTRAAALIGDVPKPLTGETSSRWRDDRSKRIGVAKQANVARHSGNRHRKLDPGGNGAIIIRPPPDGHRHIAQFRIEPFNNIRSRVFKIDRTCESLLSNQFSVVLSELQGTFRVYVGQPLEVEYLSDLQKDK